MKASDHGAGLAYLAELTQGPLTDIQLGGVGMGAAADDAKHLVGEYATSLRPRGGDGGVSTARSRLLGYGSPTPSLRSYLSGPPWMTI